MECPDVGVCQDDRSFYFKVICYGYFPTPQNIRIYKDGKSNKNFNEICMEPMHFSRVAFNQDPYYHSELDENEELVQYPLKPVTGEKSSIAMDYEILQSFFKNYNIKPTWIDCNFVWGWLDPDTGHWTGGVGKVIS